MFHLTGAVDIHFHIKQVKLVLPTRITRDAPDAAAASKVMASCAAGRCRIGIGEQVEGDGFSRWRPQTNGGHIAIPGHAQVAIVRVQIIQHAGDLQTGASTDFPSASTAETAICPLRMSGTSARSAAAIFSAGQAGQMREFCL